MKKGFLLVLAAMVILAMAICGFAQSQDSQVKGNIIAPPSTLGLVPGVKARTKLYIVKPDINHHNSPPSSAETPGSIACIYGVTPPTTGCPGAALQLPAVARRPS